MLNINNMTNYSQDVVEIGQSNNNSNVDNDNKEEVKLETSLKYITDKYYQNCNDLRKNYQ